MKGFYTSIVIGTSLAAKGMNYIMFIKIIIKFRACILGAQITVEYNSILWFLSYSSS